MLAEWFTYFSTQCAPQARELGYLRESIGIRSRYRRCKNAWQPHLRNSQSVILESLEACDGMHTALILGSGLLLDIPLAELAARFHKVLLVDLIHLPEARHAASRFPNVHCITGDVTGFVERMEQLSESSLELPTPTAFLDQSGIDWVASVNLVSQLPLLPQAWLQRRFPELDSDTLTAWGTQVMQQHLDYLSAFAAPACLLADLEQTTYRKDGEIIEVVDLASTLNFGAPVNKQWRWDVAPLGEVAPGIGRRHQVSARILGQY